jgi:hypothetical protein
MPLLDILADTAAGCMVVLNENNLDVAFEGGCATRVSVGRGDVASLECLAKKLAERRFMCVESYAHDCVGFMRSTIAAP